MGKSDPVSFECTCPAKDDGGGTILLFYRYYAAPPELPAELRPRLTALDEVAAFHRTLCERLHLKGKIRVAAEGFNVTVGGTNDEIASYVEECVKHWTFEGLDLDTREKRDEFFKPGPGGCACAFESANVRIAAEITPLGVTNYAPRNWDSVRSLSPAEFHEKCWSDDKKVLIDVRNHYESRIGYFVDPRTGDKAITPEVRRFSQFPRYVKTHMAELDGGAAKSGERRNIMTYCTGGIRCEKGVRWMAEKLQIRDGDAICTLKGGIAAYLTWMDKEIKEGRKKPSDSLFRGRNYVFDARGSTGLSNNSGLFPVSTCHVCNEPSDRLSKCRSGRCHLILVVCDDCERTQDPRCCHNCVELDSEIENSLFGKEAKRKPICKCELEREERLWRSGLKDRAREENENIEPLGINIKLNIID
ncbi:uncharacterized protein PV09_01105 [Verruconis gallopava]|uniref:Rhodanese domain-containing protein n=1 Tax=Verruconis gallopava TaxID=253628 RepID=A0A0D2BA56_9PEZI|nr:uncharacterized protein PV09_01105 [Verruconis gallopava]KIW08174.1 hypothetical protein PV09_01105 [Verruconis gallopava]